MLPVVRDGLAAEEPTLLLVRPDTAETVLQQVGPSPYLTIAPALTEPGRPALHLRAALPMLAGDARVIHQEPVIPRRSGPYGDAWKRCSTSSCARTTDLQPRCGCGPSTAGSPSP